MPTKYRLFHPWQREPVAIVNAVRLVLLAAITFGLSLTDAQLVASMAALEAVLTLFTRQQVAPAGRVDDRGQSAVGALVIVVLVLVILKLIGVL